MDKIIKKSLRIFFENSAIMQPLLTFVLFLFVFLSFAGMNIFYNNIFAFISVFLILSLFSAFLAGWFYMIKFGIDNFIEVDKTENIYPNYIANYNVETLKKFFLGVGEYFLPVLGVILLNIVIFTATIYIGQITFDANYLQLLNSKIILNSSAELPKINMNQIMLLLYIDLVSLVLHFIMLFWLPALFYKTKNPVVSLFVSIKYLFKNFLISAGLYCLLFASIIAFNIIFFISTLFPLLLFIVLIIFLYYLAFVFILIFSTFKYFILREKVNEIDNQDVFIKSSEVKDKNNGNEQ